MLFQAAPELLVPKIMMSFVNDDNNDDHDTDTGNGIMTDCDIINECVLTCSGPGKAVLPLIRTNGTDSVNGGGGGAGAGGQDNNNKYKLTGSMQTMSKGQY